MLDRSHLTILREVDRLGSVTAAAAQLNLTQSALSHAIGKLEQHLGIELWRRQGRHLTLTQAGHYLLAVSKRMLAQFELAEDRLRQYARGERGTLRIGMECHPCYQWLLKLVAPYLSRWPDVDVDVKQRFQFGGVGALIGFEIDVLVTPDPLHKPGLRFEPVFDYEQVLAVGRDHPLAKRPYVEPEHLCNEVLITYPVEPDRLDVFSRFLTPAGVAPRQHKTLEATDIMLQMVASGRGVTALPRWLVQEQAERMPLVAISLGRRGVHKQIFLGTREHDEHAQYIASFIDMAKRVKVGATQPREQTSEGHHAHSAVVGSSSRKRPGLRAAGRARR